MLPNVGFPTASSGPDSVVVSKSDYAIMISFVEGLKDWIRAASPCLEAR